MKPLLSKKTRQELREYFVGTSLHQIEMAFDAADLVADQDYQPPESGQRRCLVEQYYRPIDWSNWTDVRKVVEVIEHVLHDLEQLGSIYPANQEYANQKHAAMLRSLKRDGYSYDQGRITPAPNTAHMAAVTETVAKLDAPELQRQLERLRGSVDDDPSLAIGTAKELVETTCKTILGEHGITAPADWDIGKLMKETRKVLKLLPEDIPEHAKGVEVIRRVLASLGTVVQGLAELRNLYGTGHGKSPKSKGLSSRHARLAVGAAATITTFFLETQSQQEVKVR